MTASIARPSAALPMIIRADLAAMAEGEALSAIRVAARILVHARWRAVVGWRVAQQLHHFRVGKPISLWLTDRILGFSAAELQPKSSIGPGLVIKHTSGLVVGGEVVAGERLTLHQNVTLGDRRPFGGQPVLGDDVTVGAGACVLGPISVGDRVVIAANSVVLADVPAGCVVAGAPARIVRRGRTAQEVRAGHEISAG